MDSSPTPLRTGPASPPFNSIEWIHHANPHQEGNTGTLSIPLNGFFLYDNKGRKEGVFALSIPLNGFLGADIKPGARGDEETFNSIEWIQ